MRKIAQDIAHVFRKTKIQKSVSLINDHDLDAVGFEDALLEIIDYPAGCTDDDVRALAQYLGLLVVINTSDDLGRA